MTTGSKSSTAFFQSVLGHFPEYTTSYAHLIEGEMGMPASRGYWKTVNSKWCLWELRLCLSLPQSTISSLASEAVTKSVNKIQLSKCEDLGGFIMWFINQTASHLVTRRELSWPLSITSSKPATLHLWPFPLNHISLCDFPVPLCCCYRADYFYLYLNIFSFLKL